MTIVARCRAFIAAHSWAWRLTHVVIAALLTLLSPWLAIGVYADHEAEQAWKAGRWEVKNSLDLAAALCGILLVLMVQR